MSIRPHPTKGAGWWIIDYYPDGKKRDPVTKKCISKREMIPFQGTEADARAVELELRRKPVHAVPIAPKISDAIPEFLAYYKNNRQPSTVKDFIFAWDQLREVMGGLKFNHLTPSIIEQFKSKRLADGVKKRTINKQLSYLSALVKWAVKNNWCNPLSFKIEAFEKKYTRPPLPNVPPPDDIMKILDNAQTGIKCLAMLHFYAGLSKSDACKLKRSSIDLESGHIRLDRRRVEIANEELKSVLASVLAQKSDSDYLVINPQTGKPYGTFTWKEEDFGKEDDKKCILMLLYFAGLRKTEALQLRRDDIDLEHNMLRVIGKGNKERLVPIITADLKSELKKAVDRRSGTGFLFISPRTGRPYVNIRPIINRAAKQAGLDSKRVYAHLFRHSFGTHGAMAGVDPRAMQKIMGHASLSTTELYTHLAAEHARHESHKLATFLGKARSGDSSEPA